MPTERIVNIINFIRACEPRRPMDLFEPVVKQVELVQKHGLPATWLLQYDALTEGKYVAHLKKHLDARQEIGIWFEVVQPLVEKAGLTWRGRYPWDWHSHVGFSVGYTPAERERLIDVFMAEFREQFGAYPASMGSWFFDAHLLGYLHDRYGIVASCNCKDQYGTDGYTLWGGYWNQAYYPSRRNALMPAQHADAQIPVPVFRMLGSCPIDQYEARLHAGSNCTEVPAQGVVSLEPVYGPAGGNPQWIDWFFDVNFTMPGGAFSYAQVGQENSFGWPAMEKGLVYQVEKCREWRDRGLLRVETLADSGRWFKHKYPVTPAACVTVPKDCCELNRQGAWYDSRYYRANFHWQDGALRIRDIHLFDEGYAERYLHAVCPSSAATYDTLPVMEGFLWSAAGERRAGIYPERCDSAGQGTPFTGGEPVFSEENASTLCIDWPLDTGGTLSIRCAEKMLSFSGPDTAWHLAWQMNEKGARTVAMVTPDTAIFRHEGFTYILRAEKGRVTCSNGCMRVTAEHGAVILHLGR